jgi:hypothetical protein
MIRFPKLLLTLLFAAVVGLPPASASDLTAEQIIERSTSNRTVKNSVQTMTMKIFDKRGNARVRKITSKVKEDEAGLSKSYVRFDEPSEVEGVQFLTVQNKDADDDQWLFMPAGGGNLNRISGSSRGGRFMGSDFSYEDLSIGSDASAGTHSLAAEQTITVGGESFEVYTVETVPTPEAKSSYTRFISYVSKTDFMPRQIDFFDKRGNQIKRMQLMDIKAEGDSLIPMKTTMENLKYSTRTEILVEEYRVNVPAEELPDSMFTSDFLQSEG